MGSGWPTARESSTTTRLMGFSEGTVVAGSSGTARFDRLQQASTAAPRGAGRVSRQNKARLLPPATRCDVLQHITGNATREKRIDSRLLCDSEAWLGEPRVTFPQCGAVSAFRAAWEPHAAVRSEPRRAPALAGELYLRQPLGMEVRLLRDEEIGEVAAVWHDARKEVHTSIGIAEPGLTLGESQRIFRERIASRCRIFVAKRGESVVGFLAIRGSYIDRMYVRPCAQRGGVGTALLERARAFSPTGLELHTHEANRRARNFYEKHGFLAVRFGVSPPPENEPDVEYWWRPD